MAYIEILDLDDAMGHQAVSERIKERHQYFSSLVATAPTDQLRAIYQRKLGDLNNLATQYSVNLGGSGHHQAAESKTDGSSPLQAMLVLHTEGRALQSYPLLPGINILGRAQGTMGHTILINDDYMSRAHAVVEVISIKEQSVLLYDIGEMPGCKASTNGVFLNGNETRLSGKVMLKPNDTLQVGYAKLVLTFATEVGKSAAVTSVGKREHSKTVLIKVN